MTIRIRRKELHARIWQQPLQRVARDLGVSDVGLGKACRRYGIPSPPRGHWARKAAGQKTTVPPLEGHPDTEILLQPGSSLKPASHQHRELASRLAKDNPLDPGAADTGPESLHPVTRRTLKALSRRPDPAGFLNGNAKSFPVRISEPHRGRVVALLNAVEGALTLAGVKWIANEGAKCIVGDMDGEALQFQLTERYRTITHIEKHPEYSWLDKKTYTYEFTGDLVFQIAGCYEGRKSWADGKTQRLEGKLEEIIAGCLHAIAAMGHLRAERAEEQRRWAERAKKFAELERIERAEQEFLVRTLKESQDWLAATQIRQYLQHLQAVISERGIEPSPEGVAWLKRVEATADRIDPTSRRLGFSNRQNEPDELT